MKQLKENVQIPHELLDRLDTKTGAAVIQLSNVVSEILADNKLPFSQLYRSWNSARYTIAGHNC